LKNLGDDLTEADIDDMIADVDTDGSGWVDYNGAFSQLCVFRHSSSFTVSVSHGASG